MRKANLFLNVVAALSLVVMLLGSTSPASQCIERGTQSRPAPAADGRRESGCHLHGHRAKRCYTPHTHGTGCTLAAAIAAFLAQGDALAGAVHKAKRYVTEAIRSGLALGGGQGPTDHFFYLRRPDTEAWLQELGLRPRATLARGESR